MNELIRISKDLKIFLNKKKRSNRETYDEVIKRIIKNGRRK